MKNRGRRLTRAQRQKFLASTKGQEWLERKIADRQAERRKTAPPVPARLKRTKFPFIAYIYGRRCEVSKFAGTVLFEYEPEREAKERPQ